jgi:hypothetical protein
MLRALDESEDGMNDAVKLRAGLMFAAGLLLAGCNTTSTSPPAASTPAPSAYATQSYTPQNFVLPGGSGCAADIARWQAIQNNDYASGNIGLPVYKQIKQEIAAASAACSAGRDAEASSMIASSRRRHGYPA